MEPRTATAMTMRVNSAATAMATAASVIDALATMR